jgi:hypothetical protein
MASKNSEDLAYQLRSMGPPAASPRARLEP